MTGAFVTHTHSHIQHSSCAGSHTHTFSPVVVVLAVETQTHTYAQMNMLLLIFIWYLFVACNPSADAYCPNDEDLQRHRCTCSQTHGYIQCSSLPNACRTCYRYNTLFFNEHVDILPAESFRFYHFFDKESNTSFTIQFAQVNLLSTNTFSKVEIDEGRTLSIKISKYTASLLPSRTFDEVTLQSRAQLDIEIFNVTSPLLTIEQYALDGIKYNHLGQFRLSILYLKDTLEFQSNAGHSRFPSPDRIISLFILCLGSLLLPSFSRVELFFSNFRRVLFREHSFDHITQEHSSQLRINFDHFHDAILEHTSFFDLHQLDQSQFHLSLSNFEDVNIEQTLFDTITQCKFSRPHATCRRRRRQTTNDSLDRSSEIVADLLHLQHGPGSVSTSSNVQSDQTGYEFHLSVSSELRAKYSLHHPHVSQHHSARSIHPGDRRQQFHGCSLRSAIHRFVSSRRPIPSGHLDQIWTKSHLRRSRHSEYRHLAFQSHAHRLSILVGNAANGNERLSEYQSR